MNEKLVGDCQFARKRLFHAYRWIEKNFLQLSFEDRKRCNVIVNEIKKDLIETFAKGLSEEEWLIAMGLSSKTDI